jgi:hypothetical protein
MSDQRLIGAGGGRFAILASLLLVSPWLLGGCTHPAGSAAVSPAAASRGAAPQAGAQGPAADSAQSQGNDVRDMVTAVEPGGSATPLLKVKFRIAARPVVGMPVKIVLALIPAEDANIQHLHGSFLAEDGLTLQSARSFDLTDVKNGTAVFREVTVLPRQTGALSLRATLLMDAGNRSETRTYSIPLIAADNSSN